MPKSEAHKVQLMKHAIPFLIEIRDQIRPDKNPRAQPYVAFIQFLTDSVESDNWNPITFSTGLCHHLRALGLDALDGGDAAKAGLRMMAYAAPLPPTEKASPRAPRM